MAIIQYIFVVVIEYSKFVLVHSTRAIVSNWRMWNSSRIRIMISTYWYLRNAGQSPVAWNGWKRRKTMSACCHRRKAFGQFMAYGQPVLVVLDLHFVTKRLSSTSTRWNRLWNNCNNFGWTLKKVKMIQFPSFWSSLSHIPLTILQEHQPNHCGNTNGWNMARVLSYSPNWVRRINISAKDWHGCNNIRWHRCWPNRVCIRTHPSMWCKYIRPSRIRWTWIHRFIASRIVKRAICIWMRFEYVSANNWNWSIAMV